MLLARRWRFRQFAPSRGDLLLTTGLAVPVVGSLWARGSHQNLAIAVLLALGALVAVLGRRARPIEALLLATGALAAMPDNRALLLPVMITLYTIAVQRPWQTAALAAAGAAFATSLAGVASGDAAINGHGGLGGYVIGATASCAAAVAAGLYVGARRRVLEGLRERAERLDRERELLADRAVAQERVRIAQELHDIVAHNVSLMVVQAQGLGATVDDERVTQSTDAIAELGRQAMSEMHTTLRLLRDDAETPELTPQPGLGELERLIEHSRAAGLEIELTVEGQPRSLTQAVDLSAFRIVQEALTNVIKHATGASTKVTLAYKPEALELTILDTADQVPPRPQDPSGGHGVIGMRERAALFGGSLSTEPLPDGFKVTATLPYVPTAS